MKPFWPDIRDYIRWIENQYAGSKIQKDARLVAYIKMQRLLKRATLSSTSETAKQLRDGVLDIAEEFDLSVKSAAHLAKRLYSLLGAYETGFAWQKAPTASAVRNALKNIDKSVSRIAQFGESEEATHRHALDYLHRAASRWMRQVTTNEYQALGFFRQVYTDSAGREFASDNGHEIVERWFAQARAISLMIEDEMSRLQQRALSDEAIAKTGWEGPAFLKDRHPTAIVDLIGGRLPRLYEEVTGSKFGRSRLTPSIHSDRPDGLQEQTGLRFVRLCLMAIGLGEYSLETISRYRTDYNTANQAS